MSILIVTIRCVLLAALAALSIGQAAAADHAQWGQRFSRNMVSDEKGLPATFDLESGKNVKWSVPIGTECYATPVVAAGRVLIGTNNENPRDPRHKGDRGVMMCFAENDGRFLWQFIVPKLEGDIFLDWPKAGMCSPATVEGDRIYMATNRNEAVCLDLAGLANGNDGPFKDEGRHMAPGDQPAMEPGPTDADILWLFDLRANCGVRPHDSVHCGVLIDGPLLYLNTNNGLNSQHSGVEKPDGPSLIVLEKATGRLVAKDDEKIGPRIFHSTWSAPALGEVSTVAASARAVDDAASVVSVAKKRRLIIFCGGDGVVYAFEALDAKNVLPSQSQDTQPSPPAPLPQAGEGSRTLKRVWRFDCDPTAPKENVHRYIRNRKESPSNIKSTPVFHEGRVYVTGGGDIWWGKREAWLKCIDATKTGDITADGLVWSYPLEPHCCSTPSVRDGLVYVADCRGKVHCVDAATGKPYWVYEVGGEIWSSTLVADGKVYIGTRRGHFAVLAAGKEKRVLHTCKFDDGVIGAPVAANGTLFISTMGRLYAFSEGAGK